jgi:hypothetical protein
MSDELGYTLNMKGENEKCVYISYTILAEKYERKRSLMIPRRKWKNNIQMDAI